MTHPKCPRDPWAAIGIQSGLEIIPQFDAKMTKSGRWFVSVITGHGPDSHIGDFETEEAAKNWILTKSEYWPSEPGALK
jgi:hypothetical protein